MATLRPVIKLASPDLHGLLNNELVDGVVVSAYFRLIERRSRYYLELPCVWAFDTIFMQDWLRGGIQATRARIQDINIFKEDLLLFPIHLPNVSAVGHWALLVVNVRQKIIQAYDSVHLPRFQEMTEVLKFLRVAAIIQGENFDAAKWTMLETPSEAPKQNDAISCGVYVCALANKLTGSRKWESMMKDLQVDIGQWRRSMASAIRRGRLRDEHFDLVELSPGKEHSHRYDGRNAKVGPALLNVTTPTGKQFTDDLMADPIPPL
jgi:Ulp1 family protease